MTRKKYYVLRNKPLHNILTFFELYKKPEFWHSVFFLCIYFFCLLGSRYTSHAEGEEVGM